MAREAEEKYVLWDGEIFAMAGASRTHNLLVAAVLGELRSRLLGGRLASYAPYASDQRIRLSLDRYVYPDATVVCRPVETDPLDTETILNPRLVVEVLSDSTEAFDRGGKLAGYRSVPSLTDVVLVSQRAPLIEHFAKQDHGGWLLQTYAEGTTLPIASLGLELSVDRLYAGVFDAAEDACR